MKMRLENEIWKRKIEKEVILNFLYLEAYLSVDWHDFVHVQTLEFNENDQNMEFQQPITFTMLENWSNTQKKLAGFVSGPQLETKTTKQQSPVKVFLLFYWFLNPSRFLPICRVNHILIFLRFEERFYDAHTGFTLYSRRSLIRPNGGVPRVGLAKKLQDYRSSI